jgi:hypothetical protein
MAGFGTEFTSMFEGGSGTGGGGASLPRAKVEGIGVAPFRQVSFPSSTVVPDDGSLFTVAPIILEQIVSPFSVLWLQSDLGVLLVMG